MPEQARSDRVANEARNKAIIKAHIPKEIKESYKISMECGSVILNKKSQRSRLASHG